ncbi:MAG: S8 family serine peptidase, partial [Thermoplasmatota archaeon]
MRLLPFLLAVLLVPGAAAETWIWSGDDPGAAGEALEQLQVPWHRYERLGMVAFEADAPTATWLAAVTGGRIDPNEAYPLHLDRSVPAIEADRVQTAVGPQRDGPTVLVVDTGVDSLHPDFQDGNLAANVLALRVGGLVVGTLDQGPIVDLAGHGTHVAGIVAGSGSGLAGLDGDQGRYLGVYGNGRVASYQATGSDEDHVDTVAALEAFDWALANQGAFDIRIVNNSWGLEGDFDADHPVNQATRRLYLEGVNVVFSAGNNGEQGPGTMNKHCVAPWVLCVAAGDLEGARVGFSGQGARGPDAPPYDHPDLVAPGLFINAPESTTNIQPGATLADLLSFEVDAFYGERSGTSMAAPHVAGAAALLLAANPELSPDQVMDILTATARPMADGVERVGAGYINVREAYNLAVRTVGNADA